MTFVCFPLRTLWQLKKQSVRENEQIFDICLIYFGSYFSLELRHDGQESASFSNKAGFFLTFNDIAA